MGSDCLWCWVGACERLVVLNLGVLGLLVGGYWLLGFYGFSLFDFACNYCVAVCMYCEANWFVLAVNNVVMGVLFIVFVWVVCC